MAEKLESVFELRQRYGDERAAMLNRLFQLPAEIAATDITMSPAIKAQLGDAAFDSARAAELAQVGQDLRDRIKAAYVENELEEAEAVNTLVLYSEDVLRPETVESNTLVVAAGLNEDQLIVAADTAYELDDFDTCKTLLKVARNRDMDMAVAHIVGLEEEWQDAYNNVVEADGFTASEPEDIQEEFETYAQPEITAQSILAGDHPELNKLGAIR
jgi:hypothetical protein